MRRIREDVHTAEEFKKSRFITYLHRCSDEEDARAFFQAVRHEHPDATHHCTALKIGDLVRSSDDGEPSGTAGRPMLDVLLRNDLDGIAAVVVRYFGGTLLGKGGLVRAYTSGVQKALAEATLTSVRVVQCWQIEYPYDLTGKVEAWQRREHVEPETLEYGESVSCTFVFDGDPGPQLQELSGGRIVPRYLGDREAEISES